MGWYITRFDLPVESAVREEVQQLTTRYIVLRIHQIEVALQRIHDDAVWHTDIADLWGVGEAGADYLMASHIDDAVGDRVRHCHLTPLTAIEVERVAHDAQIADSLVQMTTYLHTAIVVLL